MANAGLTEQEAARAGVNAAVSPELAEMNRQSMVDLMSDFDPNITDPGDNSVFTPEEEEELVGLDLRPAPVFDEDMEATADNTSVLEEDMFGFQIPTDEPQAKFTADKMAGQTLILDGMDFSALRMILAQRSTGKRLALQEQVDAKYTRDAQITRDAIQNLWNSVGGYDGKDVVVAGGMIESGSLEKQGSPISTELAIVDELSPIEAEGLDEVGFTAAERIEILQAQRLALANDINKASESSGWLDLAGDVAALVVPMAETTAQFRTLDALNDLEVFEAKGMLNSWLTEWYKLPFERRLAYKDELIAITDETSSLVGERNSLRKGQLLSMLYNNDPRIAENTAIFDFVSDFSFGVFDVKAIGLAITRFAKRTNEMTHVAKQARNMGNGELSDEVTAASIANREAASVAGTDQHTAVNNGLPFFHDDSITPAHIEGASGPINQVLNDIQTEIDGLTAKASVEAEYLLRGAVSKVERQYVEKSELEKLTGNAEDVMLDDDGIFLENLKFAQGKATEGEVDIVNARVTRGGKRMTEIRYDMVDRLTGAKLATGKRRISWGVDDARGTFTETVESFDINKWWFLSPSVWAKMAQGNKTILTDFFDSYNTAARLEEISAKTRDDLQGIVDSALGPIKGDRAALQRVEMLLENGDKYFNENTRIGGRVWTREELTNPNNTVAGDMWLQSEEEVAAYFGLRRASDAMWATQNNATRNAMTTQGFKNIAVQGNETIGRSFDSLQKATSSIGGNASIRILDSNTDTLVNYTPEFLAEAYARGDRLVRLREAEDLRPATKGVVDSFEKVEYTIVNRENIGALPDQVINYRVGYIPKINEGVEFLMKRTSGSGTVNGKVARFTETLRFYGSKAEADDDLLAVFQRTVVNTKKYQNADEAGRAAQAEAFKLEYEVVPDRSLSDDAMLGEGFQASGGLYHGQRSKDDILYGTNKLDVERMSPLESIQRQANHLGNYVSKNEWRMGEQQRWINTARDMMPGLDLSKGFNADLPTSTSNAARALDELRKQINLWSGVPTKQETQWQKKVQSFHDRMLEKSNRQVALNGKEGQLPKGRLKSILWFKHFDLASATKALTFHTSLGLFNPIQLWVQAQAATMAISRAAFKEGGMATMKDAFVMASADLVKNPEAKARYLAKHAGDNPDLVEMQKLMEISGLFQSIRTNADVIMMEQGFGNSLRQFQKNVIEDKGLMFYRAGEKFNRAAAFAQSFREFKRLNPGRVLDADDLDTVLLQARQTLLELGRANAARWQGGPDANFLESVTGMMFQFGQVIAKTMEKGLLTGADKGMSLKTKGRIWAGQAGFFGMAGIPMGSAFVSSVSEWTGTDMSTMDPGVVEAWNNGATGVFFNYYFETNSNIAQRGALGSGISTFAGHILTGGTDLDFYNATPAVSAVTRAFQGIGAGFDMVSALGEAAWTIGIKDPGNTMTEDRMVKAFGQIAKISGVGRGYIAWKMMNQRHKIVDRYGRTVVNGPFTNAEELAVLVGFKNQDEIRARDAQFDNMDIAEQEQELTKEVMALLHEAMVANGGDMFAKSTWMDVNDLLGTVADPMMIEKVRLAVLKQLDDPTSLLARENAKAFKESENRIYNGIGTKKTTFVRSLGRSQAIPSTQRVVEIQSPEEE